MELFRIYVNLAFVGLVSLFPVVNPPATALLVDPYLQPLDAKARRQAARTVALYCLALCVGTELLGSWVFRIFGISLPIVQVAGGIFICRIGWQQLSDGPGLNVDKEASAPQSTGQQIQRLLFYPLTFPMTTGPGTISVLLTLSAHGGHEDPERYLASGLASFTAISLICILVYVCYAYANTVLRRLGPQGSQILNRLNAFLVFCVGLQIASSGLEKLFPLGRH
jgi:multiple antibiotic resistance protein